MKSIPDVIFASCPANKKRAEAWEETQTQEVAGLGKTGQLIMQWFTAGISDSEKLNEVLPVVSVTSKLALVLSKNIPIQTTQRPS